MSIDASRRCSADEREEDEEREGERKAAAETMRWWSRVKSEG